MVSPGMKGEEKKGLRCVAYARLSTKEQAERSEFTSIEAQIEACKAYVKSQGVLGWKFLKAYTDLSTGADMDRPGLQQMLLDARDSKFDCIVCVKIDRLSRSLQDFFELNELFEDRNIKFVCTTQDINTTTAAGRMFLKILVSFGEYERELIAERIKSKLHAQAAQGRWSGGSIPLGYTTREGVSGLHAVDEERSVVREIFDLYLALQSTQEVAKRLNERGVKTKKRIIKTGRVQGGGAFNGIGIKSILRNPIYVGRQKYGGQIYPINIPHMIDEETFEKAQQILNSHIQVPFSEKRNKHEFLLKGLLRCGCCGSIMISSPAKGSRFFYYRCSAPKRRGSEVCGIRSVPAREIEEAVPKILKRLMESSATLRRAIDQTNTELEGKKNLLEKNLEELEAERGKLLEAIDRYTELESKRSASISIIEERLRFYEEELRDAEERIQSARRDIERYKEGRVSEEMLKAALKQFFASWTNSGFSRRRQLIRKLVDQLSITKEEIRVGVRGEISSNLDTPNMPRGNHSRTLIWIDVKYHWFFTRSRRKEMILL